MAYLDNNASGDDLFTESNWPMTETQNIDNVTVPRGQSPPMLAILLVDVLGVCIDLPDADTSVLVVSHCIQLAVSVPGIVSASLAFRVCCLKPLKSSVSIQAGCLAAYDAVFLITVALVSILTVCGTVEGLTVDISRIIQQLTGWGAAYTILDITAERCFAIATPLKAHVICTPCFALKRAAAILMAGVCFTLPYTLDTIFDYSLKPFIVSCLKETPFTTFGLVYRLHLSIILLYLLPFFAICLLNVILVYSLFRLHQNTTSRAAGTENSGRELSRLVLVISAWYIVCMVVPAIFFLVRLTDVTMLDPDSLLKVAVVADILVVFDSSLNCVFYFLCWSQFRKEFLMTMCRRCPVVTASSSSGSPIPTSENIHMHHKHTNAN